VTDGGGSQGEGALASGKLRFGRARGVQRTTVPAPAVPQ